MNPQMLKTLQMLSNAQNPMNLMQQMYGNNPQFQKFMGMIQGKNPQEIENFIKNMFKEQGVDLNNLLNMVKQSGLIR